MSNEITVKPSCSLPDFYNFLKNNNFEICDKFLLDDYFFIPNNIDISNMNSRDILSKAIIIRFIKRQNKEIKLIINKIKNFDNNGNILDQHSIECEILNINDAKNFISSIGYTQIMNIKENDVVYKKDDFQLAIKNIENGDILVEIETDYNNFDSIDKIITEINKLKIPLDLSNLFIKKAEIELDKILKKGKF